jgi:hypothetical protein
VRAALPDALVERFVYPANDPAAGRLVLAPADGGPSREAAPAVILLAAGGQVQTIQPAGAGTSIGVLLDLDGARAVVGTPAALRSTLVRLMFLGEAAGGRFHKIDDRTGYGGERVVTWRVDYSVTLNANAGRQKSLDVFTASVSFSSPSDASSPTVAPGNFGVPESSLMVKEASAEGSPVVLFKPKADRRDEAPFSAKAYRTPLTRTFAAFSPAPFSAAP